MPKGKMQRHRDKWARRRLTRAAATAAAAVEDQLLATYFRTALQEYVDCSWQHDPADDLDSKGSGLQSLGAGLGRTYLTQWMSPLPRGVNPRCLAM